MFYVHYCGCNGVRQLLLSKLGTTLFCNGVYRYLQELHRISFVNIIPLECTLLVLLGVKEFDFSFQLDDVSVWFRIVTTSFQYQKRISLTKVCLGLSLCLSLVEGVSEQIVEANRPLGRHWCRYADDYFKIGFKVAECDYGLDYSKSRVIVLSCEHDNEHNKSCGSIKDGMFLEEIRDCLRLRSNCDPWCQLLASYRIKKQLPLYDLSLLPCWYYWLYEIENFDWYYWFKKLKSTKCGGNHSVAWSLQKYNENSSIIWVVME